MFFRVFGGAGRSFVVLAGAGALALLAVLLAGGVAAAQLADGTSDACREVPDGGLVPGAEVQEEYCLEDLTTEGTQRTGRTNQSDWEGLNASGTRNPTGVSGLQVDGYFPDSSKTNTNNGYNNDSQFVIRFPDEWNGKLVVTGAPGVRRQYANDFIISDYVLDRGYAFASTDKGNTGTAFYDDGSEPGGSVAEWHDRVEELTRAAKEAAGTYYGEDVEKTYITGISNGGYLTRYALERNPELYDGGVDWEGSLYQKEGPNLLTFLPATLANYPDYVASGFDRESEAFRNMVAAGFAPETEFLWDEHYSIYWDLTQRIYREEFDPGYDGPRGENGTQPGVPFCQDGAGIPGCDADYSYDERPQEVKDAFDGVTMSGEIEDPLLTLHGDLDTLLPISESSDAYADLVREAGREELHRYYVIGAGNHVDSFYDQPDKRERLRPILPCHRDAFEALEGWVERGEEPPESGFVPKPEDGDVVNECDLEEQAPGPGEPENPEPDPNACTITGTSRNDVLRGTAGRDVICGLAGNDTIYGLGGDDVLRGGPGNDVLFGERGDDRLFGGPGNDRLVGGPGRDRLFGEGGNDALDTRDGRPKDLADGGPGRDVCQADGGDRKRSCR